MSKNEGGQDDSNLPSTTVATPPTSTQGGATSKSSSPLSNKHLALLSKLSPRALAAGSQGRRGKVISEDGLSPLGRRPESGIGKYSPPITDLATRSGKYLVIGDGVVGPFTALSLRVHGLDCDYCHYTVASDLDKGVIALTPSVTQLMGDVLSVTVPSGSVVGRVLVFDHVGNDMCDIDLNEFREQGESPTFFTCDRPKIEAALLSLCRVGTHSCNVIQQAVDKNSLVALPDGGVRVTFVNGVQQEYLGVICTARNQNAVPELLLDDKELRNKDDNTQTFRKAQNGAARWIEVCVPPLPELKQFEKRFTPGSQEVVEIITPRDNKMCVRPTMMATKLFYNVNMTIPDSSPDPRLKSTSMKLFWDEVIESWTAGVPGYVTHTMFKPMFLHLQQHFQKSSALCYKSPMFMLPHWSEGGGRVIKIGHSVHASCFDAVDVSDAQGFTDAFMLARTLSAGGDVQQYLTDRKLTVMEEIDCHSIITDYALRDRGQFKYATTRLGMKLFRRYKKNWRKILKNYITLMPKNIGK